MKRAIATTVLLLLTAGCCIPLPFGDDEATPPVAPVAPVPAAAAAPTPEPVASEPAVPVSELEAHKVAEYSRHCINRFSERAFSSRGRYLQWVDEETGPTGRERHVYGVYTLSGSATPCREAVERAAGMQPPMPAAEGAATAYASAIETLIPLLQRADRYYERETYRDDDMAQAREMHPQLMGAFRAFADADRALRAQVEGVQDRAREERLARLASDPARRTEFLIERTVAQALTVVRMGEALRIEDRRYVADDPAAFIAAVETLRAGVDELEGHHPSDAPSGFGRFRGEVEEVLEAALALMRRVRDEEPLSRSDLSRVGTSGEWMTDGSFGKLRDEYNEMISAYNSVY